MALINLFSSRQKQLRGEVSDVYVYDVIPRPLRVQIVHILKDAIGESKSIMLTNDKATEIYIAIHDMLCREYGTFSLVDRYNSDKKQQVVQFLMTEENTEKVLDVIELSFRFISKVIQEQIQEYTYFVAIQISPEDAVKELNERFKQHAVGYQFNGGEIIKVDSTYIHSEVTKPTISLLSNRKFAGANEEYLKAHEHYRHRRNKECLTECLKAFESTMKIICHEKGWEFNPTDTANKLIKVCFDNGLIPPFTQNQFTSLQNLLVSGIPTIRNKVGGHGQGQVPQKVDDEMTRYGMNLAGANIIFLIEQSGL